MHSYIHNKIIIDGRPSLAMTHLICEVITHFFHHSARLTSWHTLMAYLAIFCNGEESFNNFVSPDQKYRYTSVHSSCFVFSTMN